MSISTGLPSGTFKRGNPHPLIEGLFFWDYEKKPNGRIIEIWASPSKIMGYSGKKSKRQTEIQDQKKNLTSEEIQQIEMIYKWRDYLNNLHGETVFEVDHVEPLSAGGAHHPTNLQVTTRAYNQWKWDRVGIRPEDWSVNHGSRWDYSAKAG